MSPFFRFVVKWSRTAHLYLSLFALGLLLFFGLTGFTLNHEDWFLPPPDARTATEPCAVPAEYVADPEKHELAIVEHLRAKYGKFVVGSLTTVEDAHADPTAKKPLLDYDDEAIRAVFKRPGSEVSVVLYRQEREVEGKTPADTRTFKPGDGEITYSRNGLFIFFNDLHRAKDSSGPWHLVLDITAVLIVLMSGTGIVLWLSLKGRGKWGVWVIVLGVVGFAVLVWVCELLLVRS
jgi:hypothetical protein